MHVMRGSYDGVEITNHKQIAAPGLTCPAVRFNFFLCNSPQLNSTIASMHIELSLYFDKCVPCPCCQSRFCLYFNDIPAPSETMKPKIVCLHTIPAVILCFNHINFNWLATSNANWNATVHCARTQQQKHRVDHQFLNMFCCCCCCVVVHLLWPSTSPCDARIIISLVLLQNLLIKCKQL